MSTSIAIRHLCVCALVLVVVPGAFAAEDEGLAWMPRVSVGVQKGWGLADKGRHRLDGGAALAVGGAATSDESVDMAGQLEAALLVGIPIGSGIEAIVGPGFTYGRNRAETTTKAVGQTAVTVGNQPITAGTTLTVATEDTYTTAGGKLVFGLGMRVLPGLKLELLPAVSLVKLAVERSGTTTATASALGTTLINIQPSERSDSAPALIFGLSLGAVATLPGGAQLGARVGLAAGSANVDGLDYQVSGGTAALDLGWRF